MPAMPQSRIGIPEPGGNLDEMNGMSKVNMETGEITLWPFGRIPTNSSVLATAGGLIFWGDINRRFRAQDAESGEVLWETIQEHAACAFDERLVAALGRAVEATGRGPAQLLPSGAGHDAVSMAHLTGVAMLFVRCAGGVSHHPDESVTPADVAAAVEVVDAFLRELAGGLER